MATHSSTLAQKIPWMEEPGGLQSMGSQKIRHDQVTSHSLFTFSMYYKDAMIRAVFIHITQLLL